MIDDILSERFERYHSVEKRQMELFNKPEKGMVIGRVIECKHDNFTLITPSGDKWYVMIGDMPQIKRQMIVDGQRFVIVGKKIDEGIFVACDIFKRGVAGETEQMKHKHVKGMRKMICGEKYKCAHNYINKIPVNIEQITKTACKQY